MKFKFLLYALILVAPINVYSQEREYEEPTGLNNWYLEAAGAGYLYSFNY